MKGEKEGKKKAKEKRGRDSRLKADRRIGGRGARESSCTRILAKVSCDNGAGFAAGQRVEDEQIKRRTSLRKARGLFKD